MSTSQNDLIATRALASPPDQTPPGVGLVERVNAYSNNPLYRKLWRYGYPEIRDRDAPGGESTLHTQTCDILSYGLEFHFASRALYRVFRNLDLYYSERFPEWRVNPDTMVVQPHQALPTQFASYRIGQDGPVPLLAAEVLADLTPERGDLTSKPTLFQSLGVQEYFLVDVSCEWILQPLLRLRRQTDGTWTEEQDADGGVTSQFGFRLIIDADGQLRVLNAQTGTPYARPSEAQTATERIKALEEELARLRGHGPQPNGSSPQA